MFSVYFMDAMETEYRKSNLRQRVNEAFPCKYKIVNHLLETKFAKLFNASKGKNVLGSFV